MNTSEIILELARSKDVFWSLISALSEEALIWKPAPEKWNIKEITCHLLDEEREDFRARLRHILYTPADPMPPINPVGWVIERNYAGKDFHTVLKEWKAERTQSIEWLISLKDVSWQNFYNHPKAGPISAEMILANWLAHDYLHFRQITRVKYEYLKATSGQLLDYAGGW